MYNIKSSETNETLHGANSITPDVHAGCPRLSAVNLRCPDEIPKGEPAEKRRGARAQLGLFIETINKSSYALIGGNWH